MTYLITKKKVYALTDGNLQYICSVENFPYDLAVVRDNRSLMFAKKGRAIYSPDVGIEFFDKDDVRIGTMYTDMIKIV